MSNGHPPCQICRRRHRPGNCGGEGGLTPSSPARVNQCYSMVGIVADLARICGELAALVRKLECVEKEKREQDERNDHETFPS